MAKAISISVNYNPGLAKLSRTEKTIIKTGNKSLDQLSRVGLYKAKEIAPKFTGRTSKLIRTVSKKTADGNVVSIISPNSTLSDGHHRNLANFNLPRWMHLTKGILYGQKHIHSGDPQYLWTTARYLRGIKKGIVEGNFMSINLNK